MRKTTIQLLIVALLCSGIALISSSKPAQAWGGGPGGWNNGNNGWNNGNNGNNGWNNGNNWNNGWNNGNNWSNLAEGFARGNGRIDFEVHGDVDIDSMTDGNWGNLWDNGWTNTTTTTAPRTSSIMAQTTAGEEIPAVGVALVVGEVLARGGGRFIKLTSVFIFFFTME